jgi:hypothetical protein
MILFLKRFSILFIFLSLSLGGFITWVMWDGFRLSYFRTCQDSISQSSKATDTRGLAELPISGSNRIIFDDLKQRLSHVRGKIYLVDLTGGGQEYYRSQYPMDFLGFDSKNPDLLKYQIRRFLINGWHEFKQQEYVKEEIVAREHGFEYISLYQERRDIPTKTMVDDLIKLVDTLPKDGWLHFHCRGGKGRTTSLMVMVDILKNGRQVSLEDIVKRHYLLGGINLFDTKVWKMGTYTKEQLLKRKNFIINFYKYVNDSDGYGARSWLSWCQKNGLRAYVKLS